MPSSGRPFDRDGPHQHLHELSALSRIELREVVAEACEVAGHGLGSHPFEIIG